MHAFGVTVTGAAVPGLAAGSGGPEVLLRWGPVAAAGGEVVLERRNGDGSLAVRVTRGDGYVVEAPGLGDHHVSADGAVVTGTPVEGPWWPRQRILFAMVLPLAATLRGVELLHAAAVVVDGAAIAVAAPSGGGKTTTSLALRAGGAAFLTDDVLACTIGADGAVVAHAGPRFASVDPAREDAGTVLGTSDKAHVEPPAGPPRAPLRALVVLERGASDAVELVSATPALADLAPHAFVPLVDDPGRLERSLDVWQAMARTVTLVRARVPATLAPDALASRLRAHLREDRG